MFELTSQEIITLLQGVCSNCGNSFTIEPNKLRFPNKAMIKMANLY